MEKIKIQGARIHNLKNINLTIPKHQLVVITGISGSGKSSLAFDILFEEGKNQYLRSIGILAGLDKEDRFDRMEGIGPTVAVRQNIIRQSNPRSTVGTKTGILNQLVLSGNSVIVIEHNVEVLKSCDYIIELGPEGGDKGGEIIAKGTPQQLRDNPNSRTGRYLV